MENSATNSDFGHEADDEDDVSNGETRVKSPSSLCSDRRIKSRESTPVHESGHAIAMTGGDENTATVHEAGEIKITIGLAINTSNTFTTAESNYSQGANDTKGYRKISSDTASSNTIEGRKVHDGTIADMTQSEMTEDRNIYGGINADMTSSDTKEGKKVSIGTNVDMTEEKEHEKVQGGTNADMTTSDMKDDRKVQGGSNADTASSKRKFSFNSLIETQIDQKKYEEMTTNASKDRNTNANLKKLSENSATGSMPPTIGQVKIKYKESKAVETTSNVRRPGGKGCNEYAMKFKTTRAKVNVDKFDDKETTDRYKRHAMSISFPAKSVVPTRGLRRKGPSLGALSNESNDLTGQEPPLTPKEAFHDE